MTSPTNLKIRKELDSLKYDFRSNYYMCLTLGAENIDEVKDPENLVKRGFL